MSSERKRPEWFDRGGVVAKPIMMDWIKAKLKHGSATEKNVDYFERVIRPVIQSMPREDLEALALNGLSAMMKSYEQHFMEKLKEAFKND